MQDRATLEAFRLVSKTDRTRFTTADHRVLRQLSQEASENSKANYWPIIWAGFAERFDAG